jgi:aspartyl-tRNA(Asn)/glutamyl-tRNA(Gln) amidotransferase subunit A
VAAAEHVRTVIDDIPWRDGVAALTRAYATRTLSPVEVVEFCLGRIARINPAINAIITLAEEGARSIARASERRWRDGRPLGPLDGVPLTVKDSIPVKGLRATWGSAVFADFVPDADELPVARLREAGAVVLGKTNVPEFTLHGYTDNAVFGSTRNPWDLRLTPGGSSGGAVASVAAGLVPVAIGTDGGGSIRRPASHTGLIGHKPTVGRVARTNGFPVILHDFEVIGPITRRSADAALLMSVMSGPDPRDRASLAFGAFAPQTECPPEPQRILYVPRFAGSPVDPEIARSVREAADRLCALGHHIDEGEAPFDVEELNRIWPIVSQAGLAWMFRRHGLKLDRATPPLRDMAKTGALLSAMDYVDALETVRQLCASLAASFARYDVVMTPSAAALPWPAPESHPPLIDGQPVGPRGHAVFTAFVNASGCPGISIPSEPSPTGLPIGFQLVGRYGGDALLLQMARQYEGAHPWAQLWPPLAQGAAGLATA